MALYKNVYIYCRACLVASIRSSGVSQSTIKLVATNLIANGKIKGRFLKTLHSLFITKNAHYNCLIFKKKNDKQQMYMLIISKACSAEQILVCTCHSLCCRG